MNNKTKYAIGAVVAVVGAVVAVVAVVLLTKSVVSTVLTVAIVGATVAGGYWAYKKYKDFKGKEYLSSVVKRSNSASAVSNNSPSKNKTELSQEMQEERQFMFTNNKQKD